MKTIKIRFIKVKNRKIFESCRRNVLRYDGMDETGFYVIQIKKMLRGWVYFREPIGGEFWCIYSFESKKEGMEKVKERYGLRDENIHIITYPTIRK
jgi:hypothetical protein